MVQVVFYEKPGCINNTRQKKILRHSGHNVIAIDLIKHEWDHNELLSYFSALPVSDWFNKSAPEIKSGKINPEKLSRQQALEFILEDPILIRRPLLKVGNQYRVGFDFEEIDQWIGLKVKAGEDAADLETCSRIDKTDEIEMREEQMP
jgi:nitrogenase-associated protein